MDNVWFPVLEDNQGTLSLAAIFIALSVAAYETVRAGLHARSQFGNCAAAGFDLANQATYDADEKPEKLKEYARVLDVLATQAPNAKLAFLLVRASGLCFEFKRENFHDHMFAISRELGRMSRGFKSARLHYYTLSELHALRTPT